MVRVKESSLGVQQGNIYGKWEVIGPPFSAGAGWRYRVVARCQCGRVYAVECISLAHGESGSCMSCANTGQHVKHGGSTRGNRERLYGVWGGMVQRCTNPKSTYYADYGGRGITVCDEWRKSYAAFREWAIANGYAEGLEIDRFPNNDGNYEPDNCRFVACVWNQRNRRSNRIITAFSESKCLAEWAEDARCVVKRGTLAYRLSRGWTPELAIATPVA